jgi:organic radical activating enzyme
MAKAYQQEAPFTVKVELTEGCSLACDFCGINSIREKAGGPYNFMTPKTAERIASQVAAAGWNPRFELAMHGEPSMNPQGAEIVGLLRKHNPKCQIMMTSNGSGFMKDPTAQIDALFAAGLNILALDDYRNVKFVPKVRERYNGEVRVVDYPASDDFSPYTRYPRGTKLIIIMRDISEPQPGVHNRLDNMGGLAAPKVDTQQGKRCAKPFRDIAFRWNGKVALCCDDWRGRYQVGDITKTDIVALWNSPEFMAARRKLYHGQRDFGPCHGCSDQSYRVGLLPDKKGKLTLPKPNANDLEIIKKCTTGRNWTTVVKRPWEK